MFLVSRLLYTFIIIIFYYPQSLQAWAQEVGGYTVEQWYTATSDPTVQFKLTQDPSERCVAYQMETTIDAPIENVLSVIEDYKNYATHGMPRMTESTLLQHYDQGTFDFVMGKQRRTLVSVTDSSVDIVRLALAIPWLPDNHYTLLLTTHKDFETGTTTVYWIQYDEENYNNILGPWKTHAVLPYRTNFWGSTVFDTAQYPNSNTDIYGSWTLTPLPNNKTFIHYENYADPGYWGRKAIDKVVKATLEDMPKIIDVIRNHL